MNKLLQKLCISLWMLLFTLPSSAEAFHQRPEVQDFLREASQIYQLNEAYLLDLLAHVESNEEILKFINRPAEKTKAWYEYRRIFLDEDRIRSGRAFMQRNQAWLQRAEEDYGVPASIIAAIIGVETRYGKVTGRYSVLQALATLAFDYPPRADFFRSELVDFFRLCQREGFDPLALRGSYAGAMGIAQFMPSSYYHDAIDFDGDGIIDLWGSEADAIGSVAAYLQRRGWDKNAHFVLRMPEMSAHYSGQNQIQPFRSVAQWQALGVDFSSFAVDSSEKFGILALQESAGQTAYWLTGQNFYAITLYNTSPMYAMVVLELAHFFESELGGKF